VTPIASSSRVVASAILTLLPGQADFVGHRLQQLEVWRADRHVGGEHDLVLVHDGLRVIALRVAARGLTLRESGSVVRSSPAAGRAAARAFGSNRDGGDIYMPVQEAQMTPLATTSRRPAADAGWRASRFVRGLERE
jgi:hypothetical protein